LFPLHRLARVYTGIIKSSQVIKGFKLRFTSEDLLAAAALVHQIVPPTQQYPWPLLAKHVGCEVWVKHENHTPTGAFKVRGGVIYLSALKTREPNCKGVIAATTGNHGQSIALAAKSLNLPSIIVVPEGNNPEKNRAMVAQGSELIVHGQDFQEALEHAEDLAHEHHMHMVPSFDPDLVKGVASYALELFQNAGKLDSIYVPIGLGTGLCGLICVRNALNLKTELIGVQAEGAPSYALSFASKKPVSTNRIDTFAAGLATRIPDIHAVDIINQNAARVITVSDAEILRAQALLLRDTHNLSEPAGAAAYAGLLKERHLMSHKRVGIVLSGGNADIANVRAIAGIDLNSDDP